MKNETSKENAPVSVETVLTATFMVLVALVGALGNILVILAVLHKKSLRTIPNFFLFDLAVCDLFNASIAVPLRLAEVFMPQTIPCHIVIAVTILFDGLSRINIVFVSIDRFTAVRFPFIYDAYATKKTATVSIVCGWTIMTVFAILPVFGIGAAPSETQLLKEGICFFSTNLSKEYLLIFLIVFCVMPLVLVTPINCFLLKASHRQMREVHTMQIAGENSLVTVGEGGSSSVAETTERDNQQRKRKLLAKQRRILRMILALIFFFIVLVAPITIIDLVSSFGVTNVPPIVAKIAVCMIYTNATINVFIYAGFNGEFRKAFFNLLREGKTRFTRAVTIILSPASTIIN